jgi:hypothetical protein
MTLGREKTAPPQFQPIEAPSMLDAGVCKIQHMDISMVTSKNITSHTIQPKMFGNHFLLNFGHLFLKK